MNLIKYSKLFAISCSTLYSDKLSKFWDEMKNKIGVQ